MRVGSALMSPLSLRSGTCRRLRGPVAGASLRASRRCCARISRRSTTPSRRRMGAKEARFSPAGRAAHKYLAKVRSRTLAVDGAASHQRRRPARAWCMRRERRRRRDDAPAIELARFISRSCRLCLRGSATAPADVGSMDAAAGRSPARQRACQGPAAHVHGVGTARSASPMTTGARATGPTYAACLISRNRSQRRDLPTIHQEQRVRATRVVDQRRLGRGRTITTSRDPSHRPWTATRSRTSDPLGPFAPPRTGPSFHVSWFEADAFAHAHRRANFPPRAGGEGGDLGTKSSSGTVVPLKQEPPIKPLHATVDYYGRSPSGTVGTWRGGAWPAAAGHDRRRIEVDRGPSSSAYPSSSPTPYREYSEVFSRSTCKVLPAGSSAAPRARTAPTFRRLGLPAAPADLLRGPDREGHAVMTPPLATARPSTASTLP